MSVWKIFYYGLGVLLIISATPTKNYVVLIIGIIFIILGVKSI